MSKYITTTAITSHKNYQ